LSYGWKRNQARISFDKIEAGDRLRVRYSDGGGVVAGYSGKGVQGMTGVVSKCVGSTRTMVSTAHFKALDRVWLDEKGNTVAHRDWHELEILLLERSGQPYEPDTNQKTGRWSSEEVEYLRDNWDKTDQQLALEMNRPCASIYQKRRNIRKKEFSER
jgi:hypothetical protein